MGAFQFGEALLDSLQFGLESIGLLPEGVDFILRRAGRDRPWTERAETPGTIPPPEAAGAKTGAGSKAPTPSAASPPPQTRAAGTPAPTGARPHSPWSGSIKTWHIYYLLDLKLGRYPAPNVIQIFLKL